MNNSILSAKNKDIVTVGDALRTTISARFLLMTCFVNFGSPQFQMQMLKENYLLNTKLARKKYHWELVVIELGQSISVMIINTNNSICFDEKFHV